jgi:2-alkyl-3-oxoalkanoate reductase
MKLFVTGASGFLGLAVIDAAVERGHEVVALVRSDKQHASSAVRFVRGDVRNTQPWIDELRSVDAVVHLAASFGDLHSQVAVNVLGTERLLKAMTDVGCRRLVHISTFSVYDYRRTESGATIDENSLIEAQPQARDPYTETKLQQEALVRAFEAEGNDVTIVRPGAIFGPDRWWDGGAASRLKGNVWLAVTPKGKPKLVSVWNCADAIVLCAEKPEAIGETLNIVDDNLPTQREYETMLRDSGLFHGRVVPMPYKVAEGVAGLASAFNKRKYDGRAQVPYFVDIARLEASFKPFEYSNARAKRVLGWKPRLSVAEAVRRGAANR